MIDKHEKNPPVCSGSDRRGECQKNDIQSDSPLTGTVSGRFFIFTRSVCRNTDRHRYECLKKIGGTIMDALKMISNASLKQEVPAFSVGDTVKVHVRIKEGDKSRIQVFEGTVIAKKHGGIHETFTVRRVAYGCGMERVFPLHSPVVDKVEVIRRGKVRRAKLYYLRDRVGKAAKVKEQIG